MSVARTVAQWRSALQGKPVEVANEMIVADGTDPAYEAFVGLYTQPPFAPQARDWLDRHRRMVAWNNAVLANTGAAYRAFLVQYPDSDLTATARKLEERLRNRPVFAASVAGSGGTSPGSAGQPINASLAAPTCPCTTPSQPLRKVDLPPPPKKRATKPPRLESEPVDDVVVYRRPPPRVYYEPMPGPSIGIGIGVGGYGGGGVRGRGNY